MKAVLVLLKKSPYLLFLQSDNAERPEKRGAPVSPAWKSASLHAMQPRQALSFTIALTAAALLQGLGSVVHISSSSGIHVFGSRVWHQQVAALLQIQFLRRDVCGVSSSVVCSPLLPENGSWKPGNPTS